ncbi:MAG: ABC transporter ATP-binding protein/permease [Clostridia bacterium]|nr:ABC transporter ATP-binding protein/permease [Clostridia bacterium]
MLKEKKKEFVGTFATAKRMLGKVLECDGGKMHTFITLIHSIMDSLVPLVYTIFPGLIINDLAVLEVSRSLAIHTVILIVTPLLHTIAGAFLDYVDHPYYRGINLQLQRNFEEHILRMDYEQLENPEIQDLKSRASDVLRNQSGIIGTLCGLVGAFAALLSIVSIISYLNPLIVVLNLIIVAINTVLTKRRDKKQYEMNKAVQAKEREGNQISWNLSSMDYAKDIRLFGIGSFLLGRRVKAVKEQNVETQKVNVSAQKYHVLQSFINVINEGIMYALVIFEVIYSGLSVGSMTIFLSAARQFSSTLSQFTNIYVRFAGNVYKYDEYNRFMTMEQTQYGSGTLHPRIDKNSTIEFKNVSFKYPHSDRYILENFNLKVKLGEKLCIVGENGVGKTTFVKLMTRLYSPSDGEILLDGIDVKEYDYREYLSVFTAVFQDSKDFSLTVGENVALTDNYDEGKLDEVCKSSGFDSLVKKLKKKYKTQVGKWLDPEGINLSGGELQRMTISRAAYHGGDIYLLDEPTAALDPKAEYEIYSTFHEMTSGKCAVLITHRLSAVALADKVAVFDDGHVAEYGTHSELYAMGGIYRDMFDKQAEFYREA